MLPIVSSMIMILKCFRRLGTIFGVFILLGVRIFFYFLGTVGIIFFRRKLIDLVFLFFEVYGLVFP